MHLSNDRVAGVLGATTSLWWGFDQIDMAFHNWDLQSALFYVLHMQVAFLFVCRHHAVTQRNDMCTWVICGASLASVYFFDLSRRTSGTVYGLGESLTYSGCVLSILAIAALGKGFGVLPAFRCLATEGPYRLIRHPAYAGYMLMDIGILLSHSQVVNLIVIVGDVAMLIARIKLEESLCGTTPQYRKYQEQVRYRLIPGVY